MWTWTTDRAPVTAATWACRPASADGRTGSIPGMSTASPRCVDDRDVVGSQLTLVAPAGGDGKQQRIGAQHFGQIAGRRPHPTQRAEPGRLGRQAGADGEQLLAVRHGHGATSAKELTTGWAPKSHASAGSPVLPHPDRPPSGRHGRVELGGHVRQEQRGVRRDAERRGNRVV